ncbi:AMP-binding protein [Pseudonocardia eucalypti]|uniref:AMP-binding protein n=1 Tax=Pseudonocardia eucalypti TaxID=648755 RepID=A0ABP9RE86_9PSEU|nr:fatty-acyl-CoA synthase [Pseudonocardia eucalypti]
MLVHSAGALIERCGTAYGPLTAVVQGDRRITYTEQLSRIRKAGRALLSQGLTKGDRVAILMTDRAELLDVYYGALWAGLSIVPLNAKASASDHAYIIGDSGARVVVHDASKADRVEKARSETDFERAISVDADAVLEGGAYLPKLLDAESDGRGRPEVSPDDRLGIFYTGGTTGRPKGVEHSHRSFVSAWVSEMLELGLGERDRFGHVAPLTHAGGLFVLPVWMRGGTNVILGGFDPQGFIAATKSERITASMMVPTMIYVLLDNLKSGTEGMESLQTLIYGASPIGRERLLQGIDTFGPIFSQLYGQTEAPNQLTALRKSDHAEAVETGNLEPLSSCGRPVAIADVRLVDDELNDVPDGQPGEIVAQGPHIMLGYWNKPEETASAVRNGWLCTGDVAKVDDRGFLYIVDRKKDMIISGGFNVYPKEVESTLFSHPAVRDVAVIGVPDEKWGESVKAVVVKDPEASVDAAELIAYVRERKGPVLTPKTVDFVDAIPLTAVGKHDKPALRAVHWGGRERGVN